MHRSHFIRLLLAFAILSALLLAACQERRTPAPPTPTARPVVQPPVEVIWYVRENALEQQWQYETVIPAFEREHPNIHINLIVAPWADFDLKMQAMIDAGTPPDIWSHWGPSGFQDYVRRGMVADLSNWIEKEAYNLSDFEPAALDAYRVNGRLLGMPMYTTGSFIFYNREMFDIAGVAYPPVNWDDRSWTWPAFLETCRRLTQVTGDPKGNVFGCDLNLWPSNAYALLWGKDFYPLTAYQTGFASEAFLEDPLVIDAFHARQEIVWRYNYMADPFQRSELGDGDLFRSQKAAMTLTGGYGWWNYRDIDDFTWAVAALPFGAEGRQNVMFTDPWMLSSQSRHPAEAWTFLKFLASIEIQESWMDLTGAPPVRKSLEETWFKRFPNMTPEEVREVHLGALKYGRESPHHLLVNFTRINEVVNTETEAVIKNQKTAAQVLPEADRALEAVLRQIQAEFDPE